MRIQEFQILPWRVAVLGGASALALGACNQLLGIDPATLASPTDAAGGTSESGGVGGAGGAVGGEAGNTQAGGAPAGGAPVGGNPPGGAGEGGAAGAGCIGVDLETNAEHCGHCGHSCLGAACIDSRCAPQILDSSFGSGDVVVTPTRILWASSDLRWLDRATAGFLGSATLEAADQLIAVGDTYFVGVTPGGAGDSIRWGGATGGAPLGQVAGDSIVGFAADEAVLYWAECVAIPRIKYRVMAGAGAGTVGTVRSDIPCPSGLVLDGDTLWFTTLDSNGIYRTLAADRNQQGADPVWTTSGSGTLALAGDDTHVYYATNDGVETPTELYRVEKGSGHFPEQLTPTGAQWLPQEVALDGATIYWVSRGQATELFQDGTVNRARLDDGSLEFEVLVEGQASPHAIAVDDQWVYWVTGSDLSSSKLWRVAK